MKPLWQSRREIRRLRGTVLVVLAMSLAFAAPLNAVVGETQQADRVEGIVEAVLGPDAIRVRAQGRLVTVDLSALGGVTVAVTRGTKIVAVGTMEPNGDILHAMHLEPPASR